MKKENEWQHHHYSVLNSEDRADPFKVILIHKVVHPLFATRNTFALLFLAAMTNPEFPSHTENRVKMVELYFSLLRLIEASYLIDQLVDEGKLTYRIIDKKKK